MLTAILAVLLAAAPPAPGRDAVVGEVATVGPAQHTLVVRRDSGGEVAVSYDEKTAFLRALPGATSLEGASPMAPQEVKAGDRVLCRGTLDTGGGALAANRVVVMTRGDVEERRVREQQDWRRRGIAGVVTAIDPGTQRITVRVAQAGVARPLLVEAGGKDLRFRRYAPGSVRFSDARPSSFGEVSVGDQIRVLGNRSVDGSQVTAEQVVSGAFRVVRGVVAEVDPAKGTLVARENGHGGLVRVAVGTDSLVRRLPPTMVMRLLRASETAAAGSAGTEANGGGSAEGGSGGRTPDPDEALDRLPAVALGEIQKGDEVAVLGPRQDAAAELPAIKVAVWAMPSWPGGGRGGSRSRADAGGASGDPFADVLGVGGETPW